MRRLRAWLARAFRWVEAANVRLGVFVTNVVGTMWMAYAFGLLALSGLPQALAPGGVGIVQWFAQTFLQLVLLSVILVGQNVQSERQERLLRYSVDTQKAVMLVMERMDDRMERVEGLVDALDGEMGQAGPMRREEG